MTWTIILPHGVPVGLGLLVPCELLFTTPLGACYKACICSSYSSAYFIPTVF